jgi:hypothetical protein
MPKFATVFVLKLPILYINFDATLVKRTIFETNDGTSHLQIT